MLLWRAKIPDFWLPKVRSNLGAVLVDHAHLERKAATSALNLEKYDELFDQVSELNAIAIEELQHFEQVLGLLRERGIQFSAAKKSPWISGMMTQVRKGRKQQVIDHLVACALIEGARARNSRSSPSRCAISIRAWRIFTGVSSRVKATTMRRI